MGERILKGHFDSFNLIILSVFLVGPYLPRHSFPYRRRLSPCQFIVRTQATPLPHHYPIKLLTINRPKDKWMENLKPAHFLTLNACRSSLLKP